MRTYLMSLLLGLLAITGLAGGERQVAEFTLAGGVPISVPETIWAEYNRGPATGAALDLIVRLEWEDGRLLPQAWCRFSDLPERQILALIAPGAATGDATSVKLALEIQPIRRILNRPFAGGSLECRLDLARAERTWTAAWTCTGRPPGTPIAPEIPNAFGFQPGARGQIDGLDGQLLGAIAARSTRGSATAKQRPGPRPVAPAPRWQAGAHPRLLFTQADLPRLRAWAATGSGKTAVAWLRRELAWAKLKGFAFHHEQGAEHSMEGLFAAGAGLLYQLDGDPEQARQAREWTWAAMTTALPNLNQWRLSYRLLGVALAYDLCYHAWDEEFRSMVFHYLNLRALEAAQRADVVDPLGFGDRYQYWGDLRGASGGRWGAQIRYDVAAAIGQLALLGEPAPIPAVPELEALAIIEPSRDFRPAIGVPVVDLASGMMFDRWLVNGPFPTNDPDPLAASGGWAGSRPAPGQRVKSLGGIAVDWRPYFPTWMLGDWAVYPRNCSTFFFGGPKGNGYPSGFEVLKHIDERNRQDPAFPRGIAVTLYTVWRNRDIDLVLAKPNWRWASQGVRMWLNGREVLDGQIVRVTPGLYPVLIHLPVTGGYNRQAPHLTEVTREDLATWKRGRQANLALFAPGAGPDQDLTAWLAGALLTKARIHLERAIDPEGWKAWDNSEHLATFIRAARSATGLDFLSGTGLERITAPAARAQGFIDGVVPISAVARLFDRLPAEDQPLARALIAKHGLGLTRPYEAIDLLCALAPDFRTNLPIKQLDPSAHFAATGVHLFGKRMEPAGRGNLLFSLNEGREPLTHRHSAQSVSLWEQGSPGTLDPSDEEDDVTLSKGEKGRRDALLRPRTWFTAATPSIKGFYPLATATVVHRQVAPDGSGSLSLHLGQVQAGRQNDQGKLLGLTPGQVPGIGIQRAVVVDNDTAPGVMILVDRFAGTTTKMTKRQTFHLIGLSSLTRTATGFTMFEPRAKAGAPDPSATWMRWLSFTDKRLRVSMGKISSDGYSGVLILSIDDNLPDMDRRADQHADQLEAPGRKTAPASVEADDVNLGETIADGRNAETQKDDLMVAVMTFGAGVHPKATMTRTGETRTITVGNRRYFYDGKMVERKP